MPQRARSRPRASPRQDTATVGPDRERVFRPVAALMVLGGTAAYVVAVYGVIVIGGGLLLGVAAPSLPLAVLATAVVAVSVERGRRGPAGPPAPAPQGPLPP